METGHIVVIAGALAVIYLIARKGGVTSAPDATLQSVGVSSASGTGLSGTSSASGGWGSDLPDWATKTTQTFVGPASKAPRVTADATSDEGLAAAAVYWGKPASEVTEADVVVYNTMIEARKKS